MENKNTERFGIPTEFTLTPENDRIRVKFFEKNAGTELSSDFTLPDYLPEIRKMLGVTSKISPISRYIGNSIEFSGRIDYDLIYCTSDGELASVPLGEDFSFEVQPEVPSHIDWSSGGDAFADINADMLHVRVTAPRKVNVKCRLHALVRAYGYDETDAGLRGSSQSSEKLISEPKCTAFYRNMSEVIELSDEITVSGSTENMRPIISRGNVNITDVSRGENRLNCRGEVISETLMENKETGEIGSYTKKIPFTHDIELSAENGGEQTSHNIRGICGEIRLNNSENRYLIDTEVILEADTAVTTAVTVTEDLFVPGMDSTVDYRDFKYEALEKCGNGTVTVAESFPLSDLSLSEGSEILDRNASVRIEGLSQNGRNGIIGGNIKLWVLSRNGGEYASGEISIPFALDTGADITGKKISLSAKPTVNSARCRIEGDKVICEAEISISYCLMSEECIRIADSIRSQENNDDSNSGITVYYPEKGETLWTVAKKFGTSLRSIAEMNDLPSLKGHEDLSGRQFIMIY